MTISDSRHSALRNDLYIRSEELSGTPAIDADAAEDVESNADDLVRQLLIEEKRRATPEILPPIAPQDDVPAHDAKAPEDRRESPQQSIAQILKAERSAANEEPPKRRRWVRFPRISLPRLALPSLRRSPSTRKMAQEVRQDVQETGAQKSARAWLRLPAWLRNYRPTRKHIAFAVIAGLVLYRPLMVPLVALLLVWLVLIAYLTLGPDRWGEILGGAWQRLHARRPELAERVRQRADRFAEKFDRVLDRLPDAWAERLALPDFSNPSEADEDKPDPFDRLAAEARQT